MPLIQRRLQFIEPADKGELTSITSLAPVPAEVSNNQHPAY